MQLRWASRRYYVQDMAMSTRLTQTVLRNERKRIYSYRIMENHCVLCQQTVWVMKECSIRQHYETLHNTQCAKYVGIFRSNIFTNWGKHENSRRWYLTLESLRRSLAASYDVAVMKSVVHIHMYPRRGFCGRWKAGEYTPFCICVY